jgi:RNA binding exosome subunit
LELEARTKALEEVVSAAREMKHVYEKLKELNDRRDLTARQIFGQLQAEYDAHGGLFIVLAKLDAERGGE